MDETNFETEIKTTSENLTESSQASGSALRDLANAYQELAAKNGKNLTAAIQALSAVKKPAEFLDLQQRLIKEGVEAAVSDSQTIAKLTAAVFASAFSPMKGQMEAWQNTERD